jgi:hypothetical protein
MSDVFFNNIKNITVSNTKTEIKELNLKFKYDFNNRFISLEYNKNSKNLHIHLTLVDNMDNVYFNFIIDMIERTNEKNIEELNELIKDWFEVEAIKTLTNVKKYEQEQAKLC